jgi:BASS family bile acid:Na+ symporter
MSYYDRVWGFWDIIAGLILAGWWARQPLNAQAAPAPDTDA